MRRNDLFVKYEIENSVYLLPVGQMIADLNRGIKVNETSLFIWEQLKSDISLEELLERCYEYFEAENGEEKDRLKEDIPMLVQSFRDRGMLEGSKNIFKCDCERCRTGVPPLRPKYLDLSPKDDGDAIILPENVDELHYGVFMIGGLPVSMYGDKGYFYESFEKFRIENTLNDYQDGMKIHVFNINDIFNDKQKLGYYDSEYYDIEEISDFSKKTDDNIVNTDSDPTTDRKLKGETIIHNNELTVWEYPSYYVLIFNELDGIGELYLSKDGKTAIVFCDCPSEELKENLFYALRIPFLIYALANGRVMLHSCSILYNDKAWAFSAPSGPGKSTHCTIWNRLYETPVINGDLNLIGLKNGEPYVYGTPWCGTSGVFDTEKHRLGGIILLKQGLKNRIDYLSTEQKILLAQQRLVTSVWDKEMLKKTFNIVKQIVKNIYVRRYYCTMEDEAAQILRDDIEHAESAV